MPKGRKAELCDEVEGFALLSDPTRVGILSLLAKGPKNATALCKAVGLSQPAFNYHLGLLRMGRLVIGVRQGKSVVYATDKANAEALALTNSTASKPGGPPDRSGADAQGGS